MSKAICILGMHRSGTSVLSRTVNLLGASLGKEKYMMQPTESNPEGYWEHTKIVEIHEKILMSYLKDWDTEEVLPSKWWRTKNIRKYKEELKRLIYKEFKDQSIWAWKDPRTNILLPLWVDILNELKIEVNYLIVLRHPLDVASSLEKRDKLAREKSLNIWYLNTLSAIYWTQGTKRVFIQYDQILENWQDQVNNLVGSFGFPHPDEETYDKIKMFIRPDLRHSQTKNEGFSYNCSEIDVINLYTLCVKYISSPDILNKKVAALYNKLYQRSKNTRPIYIWGAGSGGRKVLHSLRKMGYKTQGFIDSNKNYNNKIVEGLSVYHTSYLEDMISNQAYPFIVIGSTYVEEIINHLDDLKLQSGRDYYYNFRLFNEDSI
jgi:hypothetical protein